MSNFNKLSPSAESDVREPPSDDARNHFKNRTLSSERKFTLPRRHVMALLLCLLSVLEITRDWNMHLYARKWYAPFENWNKREHYKLMVFIYAEDIFVTILGGLLIYRISSHKFLLVSVTLSSILHLLMPTALNHSFAFLLVVVIGQEISSASAFTAILSMWKDWAPPAERSVLLAVSLLGVATKAVDSMFLVMYLSSDEKNYIYNASGSIYDLERDTEQCFVAMEQPIKSQLSDFMKSCGVTISENGMDQIANTLTTMMTPMAPVITLERDKTPESTTLGIVGIIWVLFWYNITSSTPQCDPLITEKEYFYLESKIPANDQENTSLKDVPWLSMVKCKQVIILFLVFFKVACSTECLRRIVVWMILYYKDTYVWSAKMFIPFVVCFLSFFLASSIFMDMLLKKYRDKTLAIRKTFLCTGFILQGVFLVAADITEDIFVRALLFAMAYVFFAISMPGVLRIPLDLAPRYVPIIASFAFAIYCLGVLCFTQFHYHYTPRQDRNSKSHLIIFDIVISLFAGIVFGIWGEVEERTWSFLMPSPRRGNDYKSYPQPDDEDDVILTPSA